MIFKRNNLKKSNNIPFHDRVEGGLWGACVGDTLGVPVEFKSRIQLKKDPVKGMVNGRAGTHGQPLGTWSDDSSLIFSLTDSLCFGYDLYSIAEEMYKWYKLGKWTPTGYVFDIGGTTRQAIRKFNYYKNPKTCGAIEEDKCGNGSLMRILPLAFYMKANNIPVHERIPMIEDVSGITHAHIRAKIACVFYVEFAISMLEGNSPMEAYDKTASFVISEYSDRGLTEELKPFDRILRSKIYNVKEKDISSSGYVLDTLEASLWAFLTSSDYSQTVLKAVNLGMDTDTVASIAGGLAGVHYGKKDIPGEWVDCIIRKEDISELFQKFNTSIQNN